MDEKDPQHELRAVKWLCVCGIFLCQHVCVHLSGTGDATQVGGEDRRCGNRQRVGARVEQHRPTGHHSQVYSQR